MNSFECVWSAIILTICLNSFALSMVGYNKGTFIYAEPPFPSLLNTSFEKYMVVEIDTFNTSTAHLSVVDLVFRDPDNSSKITIYRRIMNYYRDQEVSQLRLSVPDNISETNPFDTSTLKPDYRKLEVGIRPLIVPPFATGSLKVDQNATSNVLVIGLGGAHLTNYLHYTFPKMKITIAELEPAMVRVARKYFGLIEDKTQRVLVMNGLTLLRKAAKNGWKYDALYIDACPTKLPKIDEVEVVCPVSVFQKDRSIKLMRKVLKSTGSLVLKVLISAEDVDESAEKLADTYRKHFANCAVLDSSTVVNRMIVCSNKGIPRGRYKKETLKANAVKFFAKFGLIDDDCCTAVLDDCCILDHPNVTAILP